MLSALVRWGVAVRFVEKLTDCQIDQIGPTDECSMIARRHKNQLPARQIPRYFGIL